MALLQYENQIFLDLFQEDGLVVLAKGLGIERLLINLIKTYSDPGNLVLIIGTNSMEEEYFMNKAREAKIDPLPKVITSEFGIKDRHNVYMEGGVLFISTRILVVDMLVDRIPIHLITGIIVYRAHKILESCQEAFSLRLYRMKNNSGFVKALTSNPYAFTRGFSQVERVMKNLFVEKLYIWPRFHAVVNSSLEKKIKPRVTEMHVSMTNSMQSIQIAVLDLINASVKELKKVNTSLDTDDFTVENAIAKSFDRLIKYQLDPIWHQLSSKTHRLVYDLKFLHSVLKYLTQYDCVTFYSYLKTLEENVKVGTQISDWLFLDASETLFVHAKERLYSHKSKKKTLKRKDADSDKELEFECNPKWSALSNVLKEIADGITGDEKEVVVIVVQDEMLSKQLFEILSNGANAYLSSLYKKMVQKTSSSTQGRTLDPDEQTLTQMVTEKMQTNENEDEDIDLHKKKCEDNILLKYSNLIVEFYPLRHGDGTHFRFQTMLELDQVKYVILYDGHVEIIRRIEVHQALNPLIQLKVFFLVYTGSTEEQGYLTALRREKEAFEFLIKQKAHMCLPTGVDGKLGLRLDLVRGNDKANETVNSRQAGGQSKPPVEKKIIVDMREFRSELPSLIHRRGIDVVPVTLEVGDYILTPDICVERKSVSDLIGSLNSGRLYTQAQAMCRLYRRPILLIEFDQNKAFSLQGKYYTGSNSPESVTSKLILLTSHFSPLRLLWCTSPYTAAEMFELLKLNREQPDEAKAMLLKPEGNEGKINSEKYNTVALEFLMKLPGINSKNVWPLMNQTSCIRDLVSYSLEEFTHILQNAAAAKPLWDCFHVEVKAEQQPSTSKRPRKNWKSNKNKN